VNKSRTLFTFYKWYWSII